MASALATLLSAPRARALDEACPMPTPFPCEVPREAWQVIGDRVTLNEAHPPSAVAGNKWITMRLDGANFSKVLPALRKAGMFADPPNDHHSQGFADVMVDLTTELMTAFGACFGYTQSDEITIVIPPQPVVRELQQPHLRNGRAFKLATLAAGRASAGFVARLQGRVDPSECPHFDCRLAQWDSWEDACDLLLWRARDCVINGVSDAVHRLKSEEGRREAMTKGTLWKLRWLSLLGALPLPTHQVSGTALIRRRKTVARVNVHTGETVSKEKWVVEALPPDKSLLELAHAGRFAPPELA